MTSLVSSFARRPILAFMMFMVGYFVTISMCNHVNCHHNAGALVAHSPGLYAQAPY